MHRSPLYLGTALFLLTLLPLNAQQGGISGESGGEQLVPLWRQALDGTLIAPPLVTGGLITVMSDGGSLTAFSNEGAALWNFNARGKLGPYASRASGGSTYICRTNGVFMAVSLAGREQWRRNLDSPLSAPPLIGKDGRILLVTQARLYCFTASGTLLWRQNLDALPLAPPDLDRSGFTMVLKNGEFLTMDPFGRLNARRLGEIPEAAFPLGETGILGVYAPGNARIFGKGGPETSLPALGGRPVAAGSRGEKAAILLADGKLHLIELRGTENSGGDQGEYPRILWTADTPFAPGENGAELVYGKGEVCILTRTGISCYSEKGELVLNVELRGASVIPALSEGGKLYAGGIDWVLYAFKPKKAFFSRQDQIIPEKDSYGTADPRHTDPEGYGFGFGSAEISETLENIAGHIRRGTVGTMERDYVAWLMEVGSNLRLNYNSRPRIGGPFSPRRRTEALRLLGYLASREHIPFLAGIYTDDSDPAVKAAAAEALGRIGVDPEGHAMQAFSALISPPYPREDQILLATASAIAAI
ncbi:MAG: PQQ-like beta-propeller repeat protein, partial [Treponema sp.]|nr:PQQ-like beta-propeller repeat protein [Treponema sp.]